MRKTLDVLQVELCWKEARSIVAFVMGMSLTNRYKDIVWQCFEKQVWPVLFDNRAFV